MIGIFGVDARAAFEDSSDLNSHGMALGGAVMTLGNDGNAVSGNPALLATLSKAEIGLTSRVYGAAIAEDAILSMVAQVGIPLSNLSGVGGSFSAMLNAVHRGVSSQLLYANCLASLGFGFSLLPFLQIGGTLHLRSIYIDPNLGGIENSQVPPEWNATVGIFSSPIPGIGLSIVASRFLGNLTPMANEVGLRPDNQVAPAIQVSVGTRNRLFLGEVGTEYLFYERQFAFNAGVEKYFFKGILRVSAGLRIAGLGFEVTPSLGCGVQIGRMNIAYALSYPMSGTIKAGNHLLSVAMRLGR